LRLDRLAHRFGTLQDIVLLLAEPKVKPRDFSAKLQCVFARAARRDQHRYRRDDSRGADGENGGNDPTAALGNDIFVERLDGEIGDVKIFDGTTYAAKPSVKLLEDADSIGFDASTKYLYIDNGGGDVHQKYSMVSVVDTTAGKKVADIKVDGDTLVAMALEKSSPKIYVNNKDKNQVDVIDREKRQVIASWPVTKGKPNVAMAFDEANHRLFVGCRSGAVVVMDTQTGKELSTFPITKGVDDMVYDAPSKRIYSASDGSVDVYEQTDPDNYKLLATVPTGPAAKTARLVPEIGRYFVAVPQHGTTNASILVYEVH